MKAAIFLLLSSTLAAENELPPVSTYELDVSFFPNTGSMEGRALVRFEPIENTPPTVTFYLHGELSVDALRVGEDELEMKQDQYSVTTQGGYFLYHHDDHGSRAATERILRFAKQVNGFYKNIYKKDADAPQLHIMEMPRYGDISSGNVFGINRELWVELDETSYRARVLAHELVHPFVSLDTPRSDPLAALAMEGFPSYLHLPVMAELLGEDYYQTHLQRVETRYLKKKSSGTDRRGHPLPEEKPLLEIGVDEIGVYKDLFLLSDRALLFFDFLRREMGSDRFFAFTRTLFNREELDLATFETAVLNYLRDAEGDLDLWFRTTDYPEQIRLAHWERTH